MAKKKKTVQRKRRTAEERIADLEAQIREVKGRTLMYEVVTDLRRLPRDTWMARVGALNSFLENLANTAYGRFFKAEPLSFARTLSFSMRRDDVEGLGAVYEKRILPAVQDLNEQADEADDAEQMQMSVCWAPYEYLASKEGDEP